MKANKSVYYHNITLPITGAAYSCQISPSDYYFQSDGGLSSQNYMQNCNDMYGETEHIMACHTPALLTNSQCGPDLYNGTEPEQFYHIIQRKTQILFSFSRRVTVMDIQLDYYSDVSRNKSLPRVSIHNVDRNFNVMSQTTRTNVARVGPKTNEIGLAHELIQVNVSTMKLLLKFDEVTHQFHLSEVSFFSCTLGKQSPGAAKIRSLSR